MERQSMGKNALKSRFHRNGRARWRGVGAFEQVNSSSLARVHNNGRLRARRRVVGPRLIMASQAAPTVCGGRPVAADETVDRKEVASSVV